MISNNTYEEVYEILSYMDKSTVMKIPEDILKAIKNQRNSEFKTKIDKNDIFNENNVSKEAIDLLCWLDYHYWMNSENKLKIDKINRENYLKDEKEKSQKYNPNLLFEKEKNNNIQHEVVNKNTLIQCDKSLFKKILNKILSIIKK